jgi:methyltransferase (TIGR00027 family)
MTQLIQHVSDTAFMVAGFRAAESDRPDALFRDPLAAKLAGDQAAAILKTVPKSFIGAWSVVIRTMIIDDYIREAMADGVDTVLNLGAGLDTRPYRMELPKSLRWIEVDYPHVISLKETRLADDKPRCKLERVSFDLTDHAARQKFLADTSAKANKILVLTEGVIPYLIESDVAALAADLRAEPRCRYWIVDYFSPEALRFGEKMRKSFMRNAPFKFTPSDWFGFFAERGWRPEQVRFISDEAERLERPLPATLWMKIRFLLAVPFMLKQRREQMRQYAAYVLLTPS